MKPDYHHNCQRAHAAPVRAEVWSPVFKQWLCYDCLFRASEHEVTLTPGADLDARRRKCAG